jgi:hypothetical protein
MPGQSRSTENRQALTQLIGVALALLSVLLAWVLQARAPADKAQLRIPIGELRSQAAELELVQRESLSGRLFSRFLREHVQQLAKDSAVSFADLTGQHPEHGIEHTHADAIENGRALERAFADFDGAPTQSADLGGALGDRLSTLERGLRD